MGGGPPMMGGAPLPPPAPPPAPRSSGAKVLGTDAFSRSFIGRTISGKYLVRSVLGVGGMGTVFEAHHVAMGRAVAVKVLHPSQVSKKVAVMRFHQEARAAGAIGHPNICEVYDLGTLEDGSPYLVMERLVGETLADRISAEGGLPFEEVIDVVTQVLAGLVPAHAKGIVHRDIKPENVFLARRIGCDPIAKLLDFGVSKMTSVDEEEMQLTRTGMVMGTPFYMSPEQARGDRDLDARVDLYACGVILYEALTGRRPFIAGNYNALLLQILTGSPPPVRELRPALPAGFDRVIDRAMARGRDQRYQTATELQRDLQSLRDRLPKPGGAPNSFPVPDLAVRAPFARTKAPTAPRPVTGSGSVPTTPSRRIRDIVPLPTTPSSVEIQVDFIAAEDERRMDVDDMPTEIQFERPTYVDEELDVDRTAKTAIRRDALELMRQARSRVKRPSAPAIPFVPPPPANLDDPLDLPADSTDDPTVIMTDEQRSRLSKR